MAETNETNDNKAGVLALIISFLFPLVGVIIFFVKRKSVVNSGAYLGAAVAGFIVGIILRAIAASMAGA
jgi:tetrahydromethanopterin S-methyltransferase subunit B